MIWKIQGIEHWNQYWLNGSKTCKSDGQSCITDPLLIDRILENNRIDKAKFSEVVSTFSQIGIKEYFKIDDYAIYVKGGGFGNIYGYVVNHAADSEVPKSLDVQSRYQINIGQLMSENTYSFWSD